MGPVRADERPALRAPPRLARRHATGLGGEPSLPTHASTSRTGRGHHWAGQATPHALGREKGAQGVAVAESSLATGAPIRPRDLRLIGRPDDDPRHSVRRPSPGRKRRIGSFVRGTAVLVAGTAVALCLGFFIRFWWSLDRIVRVGIVRLRRFSTHPALPSRAFTAT